jgi:DNA-binding NarL/FixJ family response regulator
MAIGRNGSAVLYPEDGVGVASRILIVSNERMLADAVQALLSREGDMEVVANIRYLADVAVRAAALKPDVVIADYHQDGRTAVQAARAIWRAGSQAAVIFLAGHETDASLLAAVEVGASAVVYEDRPAAEMVAAVRTVAHGAAGISAGTIARLIKLRRSATDLYQCVTKRERDVLALLAKGTSSRTMAAALGVSYSTVRTHLRNLETKLAAHNKLEVLAKAHELDLIGDWATPVAAVAKDRQTSAIIKPATQPRTEYAYVISPLETRDACA